MAELVPAYGIKLAATEYEAGRKKIEALTRFKSGNVLDGFDAISESDYKRWIAIITPFHYWDVSKEDVLKDDDLEAEYDDTSEIAAIRSQLKTLYFEIEFTTELGESTTALQSEYDALLIKYNSLTA